MSLTQTESAKGRQAAEAIETMVEDFLLSAHRLSNALADSVLLAHNGISVSEWFVLKAMDGGGEFHLKDLVRKSGLSRQRIRILLNDLESKELVIVRPLSDGDKRRRVIEPTSEGLRIRQAIMVELGGVTEKLEAESVKSGRSVKLGKRLSNAARLANKLTKSIQK